MSHDVKQAAPEKKMDQKQNKDKLYPGDWFAWVRGQMKDSSKEEHAALDRFQADFQEAFEDGRSSVGFQLAGVAAFDAAHAARIKDWWLRMHGADICDCSIGATGISPEVFLVWRPCDLKKGTEKIWSVNNPTL